MSNRESNQIIVRKTKEKPISVESEFQQFMVEEMRRQTRFLSKINSGISWLLFFIVAVPIIGGFIFGACVGF